MYVGYGLQGKTMCMLCLDGTTEIEVLSNFCLLLSSYAPHISEELWSKLGNKKSICYERFPDLKQEFLFALYGKI